MVVVLTDFRAAWQKTTFSHQCPRYVGVFYYNYPKLPATSSSESGDAVYYGATIEMIAFFITMNPKVRYDSGFNLGSFT